MITESPTWPEIVFFDAMGTLLHPNPSFAHVFASVCTEAGEAVTATEVSLAFQESQLPVLMDIGTDRAGAGPPTSDTRQFWITAYSRLLDALGIRLGGLSERIYGRFAEPSSYTLYDDAPGTLDAFAAEGQRLGLISNFEPWLVDVLNHLGVHDYFEVLILSSVESVAKPAPLIYEVALERAGVPPRSAVHVGDSIRNDIEPCSAIGLPAILVDRTNAFSSFAGLRLTSLTHLPELLTQMSGGARPAASSFQQGGRRGRPHLA